MNKAMMTAATVLSAVTLVGCQAVEKEDPARFTFERHAVEGKGGVYTLTDKKTGCKYLVDAQYEMSTPLLDKNGKPDCQ